MHDDKTAKFLIADPFDTIQAHHGHGKFFEIKELVALRSMLGRNKTIVEVGANVGNHLVFYAQHMNARKIFPFEPNPDAVRLLNRNIKMNGLEDLIDGRGIGIGAGAQYGRFAVELAHEHNLGAARLSDSAGGELEVRPLDEMLKGEKVDCEGVLRLNRWAPEDGDERANLSCVARKAVVLERIGRKRRGLKRVSVDGRDPRLEDAREHRERQLEDMNDPIPF